MRASISILILLFAAHNFAGPCTEFTGSVPDRLDADLVPGDYELTIVATRGSKEGSQVNGSVRLLPATSDDRSPKTGESAIDTLMDDVLLYGSTDADLRAVGAPMCSDDLHPRPDSADPIYPGVLVSRIPEKDRIFAWMFDYPENAPIVSIGALGNIRNGKAWADGCGVILLVQASRHGTLVGDWREAGIARDGTGYFCLTRASEEPSN